MSKKLVAYFSASGVTEAVARRLAEATGSDLVEIEPEVAYTAADLNWQDKAARSTVEMADKSFRPAISEASKAFDVAAYDEVFVGFPIWWYVAPTIVNTFLEAHDLAGRKVAVFATSGSSGMGKTLDELKPSAPDAIWVGAQRFSASASAEELAAWAKSLQM